MTLASLIEKCGKANGASAEIDEAIGQWLWDQGYKPWECFNYDKRTSPGIPFSGSVDAALALAERVLGTPDESLDVLDEALASVSPPLAKLPLAILVATLTALEGS